MSNQPFASSPRSLNGTGYGTLNGKNLIEKAALSNWKRIRFPSFIDAAACDRKYEKIDNLWRKADVCMNELTNVCNMADKNTRNIDGKLWPLSRINYSPKFKKKVIEIVFSFDKL